MTFVIPIKLTDFNVFNRMNWRDANTYKQGIEQAIVCFIRAAKLKPITGSIRVYFTWYEDTVRRDKDNVAFAKKFILDALQKSGVLPNDNNRYIAGFQDDFIYHHGQKVMVRLEELCQAQN